MDARTALLAGAGTAVVAAVAVTCGMAFSGASALADRAGAPLEGTAVVVHGQPGAATVAVPEDESRVPETVSPPAPKDIAQSRESDATPPTSTPEKNATRTDTAHTGSGSADAGSHSAHTGSGAADAEPIADDAGHGADKTADKKTADKKTVAKKNARAAHAADAPSIARTPAPHSSRANAHARRAAPGTPGRHHAHHDHPAVPYVPGAASDHAAQKLREVAEKWEKHVADKIGDAKDSVGKTEWHSGSGHPRLRPGPQKGQSHRSPDRGD